MVPSIGVRAGSGNLNFESNMNNVGEMGSQAQGGVRKQTRSIFDGANNNFEAMNVNIGEKQTRGPYVTSSLGGDILRGSQSTFDTFHQSQGGDIIPSFGVSKQRIAGVDGGKVGMIPSGPGAGERSSPGQTVIETPSPGGVYTLGTNKVRQGPNDGGYIQLALEMGKARDGQTTGKSGHMDGQASGILPENTLQPLRKDMQAGEVPVGGPYVGPEISKFNPANTGNTGVGVDALSSVGQASGEYGSMDGQTSGMLPENTLQPLRQDKQAGEVPVGDTHVGPESSKFNLGNKFGKASFGAHTLSSPGRPGGTSEFFDGQTSGKFPGNPLESVLQATQGGVAQGGISSMFPGNQLESVLQATQGGVAQGGVSSTFPGNQLESVLQGTQGGISQGGVSSTFPGNQLESVLQATQGGVAGAGEMEFGADVTSALGSANRGLEPIESLGEPQDWISEVASEGGGTGRQNTNYNAGEFGQTADLPISGSIVSRGMSGDALGGPLSPTGAFSRPLETNPSETTVSGSDVSVITGSQSQNQNRNKNTGASDGHVVTIELTSLIGEPGHRQDPKTGFDFFRNSGPLSGREYNNAGDMNYFNNNRNRNNNNNYNNNNSNNRNAR